jgi:hypothetical protein
VLQSDNSNGRRGVQFSIIVTGFAFSRLMVVACNPNCFGFLLTFSEDDLPSYLMHKHNHRLRSPMNALLWYCNYDYWPRELNGSMAVFFLFFCTKWRWWSTPAEIKGYYLPILAGMDIWTWIGMPIAFSKFALPCLHSMNIVWVCSINHAEAACPLPLGILTQAYQSIPH